MQTFCYLMFVELFLTHGHIGFIAAMTAFWSHLIVVGATAISTMCRPELGWYFDVLVVPVCRLLVRTSMLRRVRENGHLGLFLMWVWSGLQLETEFLVPWRYFSTYVFVHTHCWELMNSVGSHGSSSLPFVMKVMVCHFVSDSHEVMTALIVMLPLIVVVEISLQLHRSFFQWL
jgi:hypothetical protein